MRPPCEAVVAVTGMNATDNPAPGVAVCRSLRAVPEFRGQVVGLGYDALDPGFYAQGLLDAGAILPYPKAGRLAMLERLRALRSELGIDVLLPTLDSELRAVAASERELAELGIACFVPRLDALAAAAKARLPELAGRGGFRTPDSEAVGHAEAVRTLVDRLGLPLVVKGVFYGATIVHSEADAVLAFHHFAASWGLPVIVQRYVAGEEYNVAALGDGEGGLVGAVAMRKMALTDKGKGWSGVTVDGPDLLRTTGALVDALGWRGGLEVEFLRERATGELYVLEVNPRFPAWVYLATGAGQNLPWAYVMLACGEPVPELPPYRVGTQFVRISLDQIQDLSTYGALSASGRFGSVGVRRAS
ncbi:MAG: ATP-grasp domain-containing protein [Polyangiaceae bacterium]|nr:ATP-grasp domain-containing protein [Polyangiaceae bacterium]